MAKSYKNYLCPTKDKKVVAKNLGHIKALCRYACIEHLDKLDEELVDKLVDVCSKYYYYYIAKIETNGVIATIYFQADNEPLEIELEEDKE